jgi:hypothetical protein
LSHEMPTLQGPRFWTLPKAYMCGAVMRGADALPGSKATSRMKGSRRNLGDLMPGRVADAAPVRTGKARSRSR